MLVLDVGSLPQFKFRCIWQLVLGLISFDTSWISLSQLEHRVEFVL